MRPALGYMHLPGLSRSGSGTQVVLKSTDSVGPAFCALPRSKQLRRPGAGECSLSQVGVASYRLPCPRHSVYWVAACVPLSGVLCASSGKLISGCNPPGGCQPSRVARKSWLAMEPVCSLVEDASLGPRLPLSGSGYPHLPVFSGG